MLSSVLRSKVAIEVNISIMRAFVLMRQMVIGYEELLRRIEELEVSTDAQFNELYQALTVTILFSATTILSAVFQPIK